MITRPGCSGQNFRGFVKKAGRIRRLQDSRVAAAQAETPAKFFGNTPDKAKSAPAGVAQNPTPA